MKVNGQNSQGEKKVTRKRADHGTGKKLKKEWETEKESIITSPYIAPGIKIIE